MAPVVAYDHGTPYVVAYAPGGRGSNQYHPPRLHKSQHKRHRNSQVKTFHHSLDRRVYLDTYHRWGGPINPHIAYVPLPSITYLHSHNHHTGGEVVFSPKEFRERVSPNRTPKSFHRSLSGGILPQVYHIPRASIKLQRSHSTLR